MKPILTLLLLLLTYSSGTAQVLKNSTLNLNVGGVVHDVVYDSYYDAYVVVGDFTSINGQARNNLAFIDATTFAVMPYNPITSIDGEIRTVEFYSSIPLYSTFPPNPNNPDGRRYYLYLGGNFGNINGNSVEYLARLSATHMNATQPQGTKAPYNVNFTWTIDGIYPGYVADIGVYDLHLDADTLVVAGKFYSQKAYYPSGQRNFLNAYDVTSGTNEGWLNWFPVNGEVYNSSPVFSVEKFDGAYYLTSQDEVYRYTTQGVNTTPVYDYFQTNGSSVPQARHVGFGVSNAGDSALFTSYDPHANGYSVEMDSLNQVNTISPNVSVWYAVDFENYKDYVYSCQSETTSDLTTRKINSGFTLTTESTFTLNANWQPLSMSSFTPERQAESLFRQNNVLFLSGSNLTTVGGSTRTGLAVFCLEPRNAEPFTSFDNLTCEGDSSIYTIPQAEFADGYRWSYSGTGAKYRIAGSGSTWASLVSENLTGLNANSIEVYFPVGTTGGTLTVEPFSVCNTATDYQYSEGQSDVISINQKPDIILAPTHTLNCYSDTALIVVQSTMPNVTYDWVYNNGGATSTNDTILITPQNGQGFDSSDYTVTVINPITGCFDSDTTFFTIDTLAIQINASLATTNPSEWTCLTDSMTITSNQTNYIVQWEDPANPGVFFADPFTIYSTPNGTYNLHGIQISNGCPTQDAFGSFVVNEESANPVLVGHPDFITDLIDDSLSCAVPSISLQCDVDPAYSGVATAEWYYQGTSLGTNTLNLSTADSAGMDASNLKYYTIVTTHSTSLCQDSAQIIVEFDYNKPFVDSMADQSINCSQNSVELTHPTNGLPNMIEGWLDSSGVQTGSDTITATTIGTYYYQVENSLNGCISVDTVEVVQTLDLLLDMPQDTLICPDEVVTISPSVIGNTETPSFVWSTGSTNANETATGGIDSELIVTVSTPSGCSGTDTTLILITPPVVATVTPFAACLDGSLEITDIAGGAGNYQYSLDQATWQTTTNFSGLAFGNYTVFVQDDLGCLYEFDQALDGTASTIEMLYVASTYNEEGDTIVLVNITDYTGFDSVEWILPPSADVSFENDSIAILSMLLEGWYDVGLVGYIGSDCEYLYNAPVYFGTFSPDFDSSIVQNGIQSFVVHPNPTTGSFSVALEFGVVQNYSILITNSLGQAVGGMSVSGVGTVVDHTFAFPIGSPAGSYRIHVVSDYDAQHKMIILN